MAFAAKRKTRAFNSGLASRLISDPMGKKDDRALAAKQWDRFFVALAKAVEDLRELEVKLVRIEESLSRPQYRRLRNAIRDSSARLRLAADGLSVEAASDTPSREIARLHRLVGSSALVALSTLGVGIGEAVGSDVWESAKHAVVGALSTLDDLGICMPESEYDETDITNEDPRKTLHSRAANIQRQRNVATAAGTIEAAELYYQDVLALEAAGAPTSAAWSAGLHILQDALGAAQTVDEFKQLISARDKFYVWDGAITSDLRPS